MPNSQLPPETNSPSPNQALPVGKRPYVKSTAAKPEPRTQAERLIAKFGGPAKLVRALNRSGCSLARSTIYRWTMSKAEGGTGGIIPSHRMPDIFRAARLEGLLLTTDDFFPGVK